MDSADKRFENLMRMVDKRFEDMYHYMDKRFEDMNKRFTSIQWQLGLGFTAIMVLLSVYKFVR
ncbi:MAG: hypothetical protein D6767_10700 [Candidatus Hydrogenedentota bacterium]|nr:MAG: hypothetical protein D6767_10700 [Candidatus Hydrogenedentota bacterium]